MASKQELKKSAKMMLYDVASECDYVLSAGQGDVKSAEKLLNDVEDAYSDFVVKINSTNDKKELKALRKKIDEEGASFVDRVNKLN